MQTLEGMRRRIATAEELQSVVKMMKGMAAANIRRFEDAVAALADYRRTIELGLQVLLSEHPQRIGALAPTETSRLGVVVFGSDQGMCGRFNAQIAAHAAEAARASGLPADRRRVLVVGARVAAMLELEDLPTDERVAPATSLAGLTPLVQDVLLVVQRWRERDGVDRILLCYNEALGGARYEPHTHPLFPIDLAWLGELGRAEWPSRRLPMRGMAWAPLLAALIREHFYIAIFRAAAESLASENASRLASMQAAERNIEERLEALNLQFRLHRQDAITEELLDITSGFEALSPLQH
jgi:F-type H+-transporting ATPase subunit gamma